MSADNGIYILESEGRPNQWMSVHETKKIVKTAKVHHPTREIEVPMALRTLKLGRLVEARHRKGSKKQQ